MNVVCLFHSPRGGRSSYDHSVYSQAKATNQSDPSSYWSQDGDYGGGGDYYSQEVGGGKERMGRDRYHPYGRTMPSSFSDRYGERGVAQRGRGQRGGQRGGAGRGQWQDPSVYCRDEYAQQDFTTDYQPVQVLTH